MAYVTAALLIGAGVSAYFGKAQMDAASDARKKQDGLEAQRRKELSDQAAARQAVMDRAAGAGKRVGRGGAAPTGTLGFGSGNTQAGLGSGSLFGN
jgi:hypothetical protein